MEFQEIRNTPFCSKEGEKIWSEIKGLENKDNSPKEDVETIKIINENKSQKIIDINIHKNIKSTSTIDVVKNLVHHRPINSIVSLPKKNITLEDVIIYTKQKGVVGEEHLIKTATLALTKQMPFGIEGYSGSGKTYIMDTLLELIPENDIYVLDLSSKMAAFNDTYNINKAKFLYIPELQKAMKEKNAPIVEVIKNITEGKGVTRRVSTPNKTIIEQTISNNKTIIYTLATENEFKKDMESARRFLRLETTANENHIEEILQAQAIERMIPKNYDAIGQKEEEIKKHIQYIQEQQYQVINPFAKELLQLIPRTQKSVSYIKHFFDLIEASTMFHAQEREIILHENKPYLLTEKKDIHMIFDNYYNTFLQTLESFEKNKQKFNPIKLNNDMMINAKQELTQVPFQNNYDIINTWFNKQ